MAPRPRKETFTLVGLELWVASAVHAIGDWSQAPGGVATEARDVSGLRQRSSQWLRFAAMISVLTISGMIAVHAKRAVFTALSGVPGVTSAEVELGRAVVEHDARATPDAFREAVSIAGCSLVDVTTERRLPIRE